MSSSSIAKPPNDNENPHIFSRILERLEMILNIINQMCIGFVTIFMIWLCCSWGLRTMQLHAFLVTIGYSLLMAEAIMSHYSNNMLTINFKRKTRTNIHWVMMVLGGGCGVAGSLIMLIAENFHLHSTHGKLGFSAFILCLVSLLSGCLAIFSPAIRKTLSPLLNKTFHNTVGLATFVLALSTQYYGYYFLRSKVDLEFRTLLECVTLVSLFLTCIGPLKALFHKICNLLGI